MATEIDIVQTDRRHKARVAQVGVGYWGANLVRNLAANPGGGTGSDL
jgi:hypothetical protein